MTLSEAPYCTAAAAHRLKSAMPYHGVPTPLRRRVCKATFVDVHFATALHWQTQVLRLWRNERFREERSAAPYLTSDKRAQPFQTLSTMKMYEELIVTGAWWDYVDDIASHRIGPILRDHPVPMRCKMLSWSKSSNLRKRHTSIICQLGMPAALCELCQQAQVEELKSS